MDTAWIEPLAQFGVAGLMGVLWIWERSHSRLREQQLSEAHERLVQRQEAMATLCDLVRRNTEAIERFDRTQAELRELLRSLGDERKDGRRMAKAG